MSVSKLPQVYALVDLTTDPPEIRYVGKTTNPSLQDYFKAKHIANAKRGDKRAQRHVYAWLRKINFLADIVQLGVYATEELAFQAERDFIKQFRSEGFDLTNLTEGGEGVSGHKPTDETIARMSKSLLDFYKNNPDAIRSGWQHSREARDKISVNNARYWKGLGPPKKVMEKLRASAVGRKQSAEERTKRSHSLKEFYKTHKGPGFGKSASEETRKKLSAALKGKAHRKQTMVEVDANRKRALDYYKDPAKRIEQSVRMKQFYKEHPEKKSHTCPSDEVKQHLSIVISKIQNNPVMKERNRQAHLGKKWSAKQREKYRVTIENKYLTDMRYDEEQQISFGYPCGAMCV